MRFCKLTNDSKNKDINNINDPKRSTALVGSVKYLNGGLKPVSIRANLPLSSDVD